MTHKTDKQFLFEAGLNWLSDERGVLYAHDVKDIIHVSAPAAFGGTGKEWSPEHLFLSAIISGYMSTFLGISKKMGLPVSRFECNAIGQVEMVEDRYRFTNINLYPKIFIADDSLRERAAKAAEKTQRYCLISNSLDAAIIYHTEVLIAVKAATTTATNENQLL